MKTSCKRFLCLLLCLLMIVSCVPVVGAEGSASTGGLTDDRFAGKKDITKDDVSDLTLEENTIYYNKEIDLEKDGTYTITLNSFVTGAVTPQPVPMDIVLVVDQSASMVNNAMSEAPDDFRFMTQTKNYTYGNLLAQPRLYYKVDDVYYDAKIERDADGTAYGRYAYEGTRYYTSGYTNVLTRTNNSTMTLSFYHVESRLVSFLLESYNEGSWLNPITKYRYYNASKTSEKTSGFSTKAEAYDYLCGTYLSNNYSDHYAIPLTSNGSTYMDEVYFCVPLSGIRWEDTQYTISYYKDGAWKTGETLTCDAWNADTTKPTFPTDLSLITAKCTSANLYIYSRNDALQQAAYAFVEGIQALAKDQNVKHRIAIAGFGCGIDEVKSDGSNEGEGSSFAGTDLLSTTEKVNFADAETSDYQNALQSALTDENTPNTLLLEAVERIDGKGSTFPNYGLEMAQSILNARTEKTYTIGNRDLPRRTVVILFTDGVPGCYDKLGEFADYDLCGPVATADRVVAEAKKLKDAGATVYTLGMLSGADPAASYKFSTADRTIGKKSYSCYVEQADAINAFLHFISSDYPDASEMDPKLVAEINNGYYYAATTANALSNAFNNITENVAVPTIALTADAVTRDVMSEDFTLPGDIEARPDDYIRIGTMDYLGDDQWSEITWTDEYSLTVNYETQTVDVTGFDYEANYVHEAYSDSSGELIPAGGRRLVIVIHGITAKHSAVQNQYVNTNDPSSGIYSGGTNTAELVVPFNRPTVMIQEKYFVLDYLEATSINTAELGVFTPLHLSKNGMDTINYHQDSETGELVYDYKTELEEECANGNVLLKDGTLHCIPTIGNFHEEDFFYLFGLDANDDYVWTRISILPANNVFYEDDWATYSDNWTVVGESNGNTEVLNNEVHGYIDSKANETGYSNGTAHFTEYEYATAEFTFTGTGIDVYCRTDNECGVALALLTPMGETVATDSLVMDVLSSSGTYYQIPAIFFHDLPYGTYTLKLTIRNAVYDGGRDDFYLDGFRVYNPMDLDNEMVKLAYGNEYHSSYTSIRDLLIQSTDGVIDGMVFIDEVSDEFGLDSNIMADYVDYGPKNEVYLAPGNSIILRVDPAAHYYMGIKSPNGNASVSFSYGEGASKEVAINSTADLYYEVIPSAEGYLEIKNTSENGGLLSLTKLRTSGSEKGLTLRSATAEDILRYADSFDTLGEAQAPTIGAPTVTKLPKQPKPIFRKIQKPIIGRELQ